MLTRRWKRLVLPALCGSFLVATSGCQKQSLIPRPRQSTLAELARGVAEQNRAGGFSRGALLELARGVLEREVFSATDEATHQDFAAPPISELSDCAGPLRRILLARAEQNDDTAYAARFSLVQGGDTLTDSEFEAYASSKHGFARASAALDTIASKRWYFRTLALSDPDRRVRLAALEAAARVPAEQDRRPLTQLLRGAPDLASRARAAKALGVLGGEASYQLLCDVWANAEPELRLGIVNGFAQRACFEAGGQERLQWIARSEPGIVGVAAAASLFEGNGSSRLSGQARLVRALDSGSTDEKRLSVQHASWNVPEHAERLIRLGLKDPDRVVRVAALSRWLERKDHTWPAMLALRELSEGDTTEGLVARGLLARQGDWSSVQLLRAQQRSPTARVRLSTALDLLDLGDYSAVAMGLADDSPTVRLKLACAALAPRP